TEGGRRLILATDRIASVLGPEAAENIVRKMRGSDLLGMRYRRPFDWVDGGAEAERAWQVRAADFVSADDGTGIVHIAPAYGADDYALGQAEGLPIMRPVDDRGTFPAHFPTVGGKFVKDADADLVKMLRERGAVHRYSRESHSYPHCWRCGR